MIILYNPHVDDFLGEPPHFRLLGRRPLKKYGFLLDEMLKHEPSVQVVVDGTISAYVPESIFKRIPRWLRMIIANLEYKRWVAINKLSGRVDRLPHDADTTDKVLLMFTYKGATGLFAERLTLFRKFRVVIAHLSHYFISTRGKSDNLFRLENVYLAGDSDITKNFYFQRFFPWYSKPFLVLPFSVAPRFEARKGFADREARCVATGSFHNLEREVPRHKFEDFLKVCGSNTYHPVRKLIYEQASTTGGGIVSYVAPYRQTAKGLAFKEWLSHFWVKQKEYFRIDLTRLYNDFRFAVVGEELSGFPALGAFEAMACGAILIAEPHAYEGLGLKAGEHYAPHDGSIEGIVSAIETCAAREDGGAGIAAAGRHFVEKHFRPSQAYARWMSSIAGVADYRLADTAVAHR